jgi:ornithine--oxo-acid transaminase
VPFDLAALLEQRRGENFELHARYLNPQLTKVVKTLGFDRFYERGEGCYLYDAEGQRYLDLLSGFGVFALGRSHPVIKDALAQALEADLPNMVQMDCALLPGLLAEALLGCRSGGGRHKVRPRRHGPQSHLLPRARVPRLDDGRPVD